jgi:elongation factor P
MAISLRDRFPDAQAHAKPRAMISTSDFKRNLRIQIDGEPYVILDVHVQSPSARGASSLSKIKVRNLKTGQVFNKTFRGGDKVEEPNVELRPIQFLYKDDDGFHFMDTQSYEQFALTADELGDNAGYLKDGMSGIRSVHFNDQVISVELPNTVVLEVVDTAPTVKGGTAQAQTKPATLETGLVIQVPAYLESGELVQVDTREARFIARAKS